MYWTSLKLIFLRLFGDEQEYSSLVVMAYILINIMLRVFLYLPVGQCRVAAYIIKCILKGMFYIAFHWAVI